MKEVGEYEWRQVSMWETTPENCIEKYIEVETGLSGKQTCLFYLKRVSEVVNGNIYRMETVTEINDVPDKVLNWKNNNFKVKGDNHE
jgi:hypothetical protein